MSELIKMKSFDQVVETTMQTNIKSVMERTYIVKDIIELNIFFAIPETAN